MPIILLLAAVVAAVAFLRKGAQAAPGYDPRLNPGTEAPPSGFGGQTQKTVNSVVGKARGIVDGLISNVQVYAPEPTLPAKPVSKPAPKLSLAGGWGNAPKPAAPKAPAAKPAAAPKKPAPAPKKPQIFAMNPPATAPVAFSPPPSEPVLWGAPPAGDLDIAPPTYRDEHDHPVFETAEQAETWVTKGASSF